FVMFAAHTTTISSASDRLSGAYARTRTLGVSRTTFLAAGVITSVAVAICFMGMMTGSTFLLFGVRWGEWLAWGVLTLATATTMAALSFVLASVMGKPQILEQVGSTLFTVLSFLGGSSMPLPVLPVWLASALSWLPNRVALEGYFTLI